MKIILKETAGSGSMVGKVGRTERENRRTEKFNQAALLAVRGRETEIQDSRFDEIRDVLECSTYPRPQHNPAERNAVFIREAREDKPKP